MTMTMLSNMRLLVQFDLEQIDMKNSTTPVQQVRQFYIPSSTPDHVSITELKFAINEFTD